MIEDRRSEDRDLLSIALRAFVPPTAERKPGRKRRKAQQGSSEWTLIFDTETRVDAGQAFRFGAYQVRKGDELFEAGLFYDPEELSDGEQGLLRRFAFANGVRFMTKKEFTEDVLFKIGYELRAAIVGFNLPYDLSRLAIDHASARRGTMKGGFSLRVWGDRRFPRIQIKHLSARASLIQFTKRYMPPRGMRKRGVVPSARRGSFIDVKTIAAALTSRSFTLKALADHLETENRKHSADEHGGPLTEEYIAYAAQDVQVTWECFCALRAKFDQHGLSQTGVGQILSEASLGKACLREMGIRPWQEVQPDFPDALTGITMSTYYGGRSEMHIRRRIVQVLYCDFLSMYPTVCTLMGLWRFVIAKGMKWRESTADVSDWLETVDDVRRPDAWRALTALVQISPDKDTFPIRANYGGAQPTIGLNNGSSGMPIWLTLADCVVSKLRTGKAPKVLRAITFEPEEPQEGLKPFSINGNATYRIDPNSEDFYRRLIDLRISTKQQLKCATGARATALDTEQESLKIIANATSYGIFVELMYASGEGHRFAQRPQAACAASCCWRQFQGRSSPICFAG